MKKILLILLSLFICIAAIGCSENSDKNNNNSNTNNVTTGTGSFSDIAAQFLPEGYPVLNLPNEIQYTQTTTIDNTYLELITTLQQTDINTLLETLSNYYNTQFDTNNNQWYVENNNHSLELKYNSSTGNLTFNFIFKPEQEIPVPTDTLNVKDYIYTNSGILTNVIMLSTDGKIYGYGRNSNGELGNGTICKKYDFSCWAKPISEAVGINEKITKLLNIDNYIFAVTETGNLYFWGNGNPTPTMITASISGVINNIIELDNYIKYLYTDTNNLYELKLNDNIWNIKEIIIPNETIRQIDASSINLDTSYSYNDTIYILTASGKQYYYNQDTQTTVLINGIDENIKYVFHGDIDNTVFSNLHIAITESNKIYGWGSAYYSEILGEDTYNVDVNIPKLLTWDTSNGMINKFFINTRNIYAITDKGLLYKFGYNAGIISNINNIKDVQIAKRSDNVIFGTYAITSDGSVYKIDDDKATFIDNFKNINKLYVTYNPSYGNNIYAITEDGDVYSYGSNYSGMLGIGEIDESYKTTTVTKINIPETVKDIYINPLDDIYSIYAVTTTGNLYAWGNNTGDYGDYGVLGSGNTTDEYIPAPVKLNISNVLNILNFIGSTGEQNSRAYALTSDNKLYYWGYKLNSATSNYSDVATTPQMLDFEK